MTASTQTPRIIIRNAQRKLRVDAAALSAFADAALCVCRATEAPAMHVLDDFEEITVALVSDRRISELHKRFMNIAGATDVLTFDHGEIVVSVETAERNAKEYQSSTEAEIRLYIVHGMLHLIGFDDTTPAAARVMAQTQERVVAEADARLRAAAEV
jgi:probable rRNA maturation factor